MFVGHFAAALTARRLERRASLGACVVAAMLADLIWPVTLMLGLESAEFGSGRGAGQYITSVRLDISHSLAMLVIWGAVFSLAYRRARQLDTRATTILFLLVLSHWVLDVISATRFMPIAPGLPWRVGLGLWTSLPATLVVEGGCWLAALVFFVAGMRFRARWVAAVFWIGAALLTLLWWNNIAGPAPPADTAPLGSLIVFSLAVAWAYLVEPRHEAA